MSKKFIFIALIFLVIFFIFFFRNKTKPMVSPTVASPVPSATINQPKEIKYDNSTDLKKELESVDPQVLDSDFKN